MKQFDKLLPSKNIFHIPWYRHWFRSHQLRPLGDLWMGWPCFNYGFHFRKFWASREKLDRNSLNYNPMPLFIRTRPTETSHQHYSPVPEIKVVYFQASLVSHNIFTSVHPTQNVCQIGFINSTLANYIVSLKSAKGFFPLHKTSALLCHLKGEGASGRYRVGERRGKRLATKERGWSYSAWQCQWRRRETEERNIGRERAWNRMEEGKTLEINYKR